MKVILLTDVKDLGKKDQIVNVSDGYGQNYLIPRKLARAATEGAVNDAKDKQRAKNEKMARQKKMAQDAAKALAGSVVTVRVKVGDNGKLFGAVSTKDIADALKAQKEIDIDRKKLEIKEPIKQIGKYTCLARLYPEVTAEVKIEVLPE